MKKAGFCLFVGLFVIILLLLVSAGAASTLSSSKGQWDTVGQFSYNLMKDENTKTHNAKLFRRRPGLHVRHDLHLRLVLQPRPQASKLVPVLATEWQCDDTFTFKLLENETDSIFTWTQRPTKQNHDAEFLFQLFVNRSIPVGKYSLTVYNPCYRQQVGSSKVLQLCDVYVMFNPRSGGEVAYKRMRRQIVPAREEYIENNHGYIWRERYYAIPWDYAVGSKAVTDSTSAIVQMMTQAQRSDPVLYSRALSQIIGNNVLLGRWGGPYIGGVDPTQWVGSEAILSHWLQTKQPVRYGQCWVFAAIFTTLLRASGILARPVTNYDSHHDRGLTDDETAVLRQYDNIAQADEMQWNFHVWTEAWLERPDLGQPAEWNALDATPQEPSPLAPGQPYRAGPAYVPYIKFGQIAANYDTFFILAEVNARKYCPITGSLLPIGTAVLTKKPGLQREVYNFQNPEEITGSYKIATISKRATDDAEQITPPPYIGCERDGGWRIRSNPPSPMVGEGFVINLTSANVSVGSNVIRAELMSYTGEPLTFIDTFTNIDELNVTELFYLPYLHESNILRFTVGVYNESGGFVFHDVLRVRLQYKQLDVQANRAPNSSMISLIVTYTNPLSIPMTGVMLSLSTPNSTYMRLEHPDIPPNARFTTTVEVQCCEDDNAMVPVSLDSNETQSVYGMGWSTCSEAGNGGGTLHIFMSLQVILVSLFTLFLDDD